MPPDEVLRTVRSREQGLPESEVAARLALDGANELPEPASRSIWSILLDQVRSIVVLLLAVAALASLLLGDNVDAGAITVVLLLNVLIGFVTELRARNAITGLLALQVPRATVVRDGEVREIDARDVVPGDVIAIEAGQAVPADARLIHSTALRTMEAALTGESLPVDKSADAEVLRDAPLSERDTMVYQGTTVVAGSARAVVVGTGASTEVGRIGVLTSSVASTQTPLERNLASLGSRLALAAIGMAIVIAVFASVQGEPLTTVLQTGIAVAIAAVPEGLPAVVTIAMAVGVRRMARRRALVRRLPAVESLGSTTVICTDKTGTLTAGEQTAVSAWIAGRELTITGSGYSPEGALLEDGEPVGLEYEGPLREAFRVAALANHAQVTRGEGGWEAHGDPTDAALLVAARKAGVDRSSELESLPRIGELPFDSSYMLMASYHRSADGSAIAFVKGAPRSIVSASNAMVGPRGVTLLDGAMREALLRRNSAFAERGLRVIALATGAMPSDEGGLPRDLLFLGFIGIVDPPAPGVKETITRFREAGIRTVMLTGDQLLTAQSIARSLGLLGPGDTTVDGAVVERASASELASLVERGAVFSRMSPGAKLRVIAALQRRGEIVAMLGDGVNDAAALQRADIGVAMGRRGTDVAKQVADIVLQDDRFSTIGAAVEEGRVVFANIRKFVYYLFSCNAGELLVLVGAGVVGLPLVLLPLQILWLNLVTDTLPALALALEPAEPGIMRRAPRSPQTGLFSAGLVRSTIFYAALIAGCTLAAFVWGLSVADHGSARHATTLSFMTLALAQLFHLGNARGVVPVVAPHRALANPYAIGAVAIAIALQVLAVSYAPLASVLGVRALALDEWLVVSGLAVIPGVVGQLLRLRRSRSRGGKPHMTYGESRLYR
jgi:Ca2+-transporting ATPase